MAAGPKEVAGRRDSLPAQKIAADPLQSYCPDLDQWPRSWAYEARDIPYGLRMVECFKPFLREMLALPLSRTTLRRHRDNIWVLGGEEAPGLIGQERAVEAISLAMRMRRKGYNVYALGPSGTGRHSHIEALLRTQAESEPNPPDWCYVNQFR